MVLKKISTKKLAVYIGIIFIMLSGTGLMVYINFELASPSDTPSLGILPEPINETANKTGEALKTSSEPTVETKPIAQPSQTKNKNEIDLSVLASEKFLNLKDNSLISTTTPEKGKRDPFKPN